MIRQGLSNFLRLDGPQRLARELLLSMDPERAHAATLTALKLGAVPAQTEPDPASLAVTLAGLDLPNPVGMAAGFDKNAEVPRQLCTIGFGFAEVGTITPLPQPGNPKPRIFRLEDDEAVINRYGFNSEGHEAALKRLKAPRHGATIGVNIGANKLSEDFVADYVLGVKRFAPVADYLTVNISSPNTPGLRDLQTDEALKRLLGEVLAERSRADTRVPVFLKLAPDLNQNELDAIAAVIASVDLDGLIMSNTTLSRETVKGHRHADEAGGLSGAPLFNLATQRLAQLRLRVGNTMPIIGVGGVHSSASAVAKLAAGANAIQLYTALVYRGMELMTTIKQGLDVAVREAGANSVTALTSTAVEDWAEGKAEI